MGRIHDPAEPCTAAGHYEWLISELGRIETAFSLLQDQDDRLADVDAFEIAVTSTAATIIGYVRARYPHNISQYDNWKATAPGCWREEFVSPWGQG